MNTTKKDRKALSLDRETLRTLQSSEITIVVGGVDNAQILPPTVDSARPMCCR